MRKMIKEKNKGERRKIKEKIVKEKAKNKEREIVRIKL